MNLIIFTSHYPYGNKESFLEDEINELCKKYNFLYIISSEKDTMLSKRRVPNNCIIINANINNKFKYFLLIFITLIFSIVNLSVYKELFFIRNSNFKFSTRLKTILKYRYRFIRNIRIIKRIVKKKYNEKFILYSYWLNGDAYSICKMKKNKNISGAISRAHGSDAKFDIVYNPFRADIIRGINKILFVSEILMNDFINKYKNYKIEKKVDLLRLGTTKTNVSSSFSIKAPENYKFVLSISNVVEVKRLDYLIDSLSLIDELNIYWVHIGSGVEYQNINEYCYDKLHLKDNIKYHFTGSLPNRKVKSLLLNSNIDLLCNTSDSEGIPVSIMECLSYGIPVIARDVGGLKEIVIDSYNGILLKSDLEPKYFSQAIIEILNLNKKDLEVYKNNCEHIWKERYSFDANINRMITLLDSLFIGGADELIEKK